MTDASEDGSTPDESPEERGSPPQPRWKGWGSRAGGRKADDLPEVTGKFYGKQGPHFKTSE